jgi:hypothetical protein
MCRDDSGRDEAGHDDQGSDLTATTDAAECGGCEVQIRYLDESLRADHIIFFSIFL